MFGIAKDINNNIILVYFFILIDDAIINTNETAKPIGLIEAINPQISPNIIKSFFFSLNKYAIERFTKLKRIDSGSITLE